jgi:hypothetical protein
MGFCNILRPAILSELCNVSIAAGKEEKQLPYLLYLQGGPGFECGRPTEAGGWVKKACEEYRVILLDQATCYLLCFDYHGFFCFGRLCN